MKIVTVLGARPQFIKASAVSKAIEQSHSLSEVIVHTGQHFDKNMSDVFFSDLALVEPRYHLGIGSGPHGQMTGRMLESVEQVLSSEKPDAVLVYGDTNSTLAGALAAVKLHIAVAHVEAGLRSFDMRMPEEVNRVVTDRISQWLFTPTRAADENLRKEGVDSTRIARVGDVMFDVALRYADLVTPSGGLLSDLGLAPGGYALATIHRAENTDDPDRLLAIVEGLSTFASLIPVVFPLHPRTKRALLRIGQLDRMKRVVRVIDPVGYLSMVQLERFARLIATDSGGVQKEAFFYSVPCVTLRDRTEWIELLDAGWNRLAPPTSGPALAESLRAALGSHGSPASPYGDGNAALRIVEHLERS
jgi:UDP-GlcNAc3NAcA epimerase